MNKYWLPIGVILLALMSCSDEFTIYEDSLSDNLILETDKTVLQNSVSVANAGVIQVYKADLEGKFGLQTYKEEPAGNYPITLVAQVNPPVYNGSLLTSTHVNVSEEYAFISYNTSGETYMGAVDIIRISDPANPILTSRLYYTNADINALVFDSGYLYIAGGVDAELSAIASDNSFVGKIPVINGVFDLSAGIDYGFQPGQNANDILIDGNNLVITSGAAGQLTVLDKYSLNIIRELPFPDLRSLAKSGPNLAVLDGGTGVTVFDPNYQSILQIPIATDLGAASKRTLDFDSERIVVPEAGNGAGVYDANSGNLLEYIEIPTNPILEIPENKTTNAVGLNESLILMANGGGGLSLAENLPDGSVRMVGILELEGSINHLSTKGDYLIAASGTTGIQILKFNRPSSSLVASCSGIPNYTGGAKLSIGPNEDLSYSGSKNFRNINVYGSLLLCGSWTVRNNVTIRNNGLFQMNGNMTIGRNNRRRDLRIRDNAVVKIEGDLTIYGDLILGDGATLEFVGTPNSANILGSVVLGDGAQVLGEFDDIQDHF